MEWTGYIAGFCTTLAFLPQVIRTYKTQSAKDISLGMYLVFCFGVVMWLFYGFSIHSMAIIWANTATILLAGSMLLMKIIFDRREKK
ncbi:MAG: SemiSWEET transporter [Pseudomonadota bacterium]